MPSAMKLKINLKFTIDGATVHWSHSKDVKIISNVVELNKCPPSLSIFKTKEVYSIHLIQNVHLKGIDNVLSCC